MSGLGDGGLLMLAALLLAAGLVSGFIAGLFGIGGGAVTVPAVYEALSVLGVPLEVRMHVTLGTALAAMSAMTIRSFFSHRAKGNVDVAFLRRIVPWVLLGVLLGAVVARYAQGATLKWIWVVLGSLMAFKMAFARDSWRLGDDFPKGPLVEIWATLVGLASTLMSVGGTAFMTTLMTLYGRPLLPSLATCSGLGPVIAIPGALGFVWAGLGQPGVPLGSIGYVNLIGLALLVPTGVWAAPFGVRAAHGISRRTLELLFAGLMMLVVLRFVVSLVG